MNQQLATVAPPRLPMPEGLPDHLRPKWRVLCEAIFPNAKTADGIMLAVEYCSARGLDIMKRPVNVVAVWSKAQRKFVENVWPSINEIQVTASRTNAWAGMDHPEFGPTMKRTFNGLKTVWVDRQEITQPVEVEIEFPEWCEVTVYRLVQGTKCSFVEPVYWLEAYARMGQTSELPTDMWVKRPKGQLIKVAKAFSLRAAFPEEAEYSAEEMAGQTIDGEDEVSIPNRPASPPSPPAPAAGLKPQPTTPPHDAETGEILPPHTLEFQDDPVTNEPERWDEWGRRFVAHVRTANTEQEIVAWENLNMQKIAELKEKNQKVYAKLEAAINAHRLDLKLKLPPAPAGEQ